MKHILKAGLFPEGYNLQRNLQCTYSPREGDHLLILDEPAGIDSYSGQGKTLEEAEQNLKENMVEDLGWLSLPHETVGEKQKEKIRTLAELLGVEKEKIF